MALDAKGAYHFSPLESKQVGKLCEKHGGTILLSTPTFLRSYLKRCEAKQFDTVEVVVTGAEKLPVDLCDQFEAKFGVRPVEGYGATETSPLVSVNVPGTRSSVSDGSDAKEGTVGRPIPGVEARIVDRESGVELPIGDAGMLHVKGPNIMKGYLGRDDLTSEVIQDGWYVTGDIARLDEDGFIQITGRVSRFSKIGGEMVPHGLIEEALGKIVGQEDQLLVAVTAVPDARKGERLIVVHVKIEQTPKELCDALKEAGLPNLYIPSPDSFMEVDEIPILGTGKLDLTALRALAEERFGGKP